jgi:glutathione S-transferase
VAEVLNVSPTGRVPALHADGQAIWDSLAIAEWAAEQAPAAQLWPTDPWLRALARSVTCEMHAGFAAIRRDLPMNIQRRCPAQHWLPETRDELDRINQMWTTLRQTHAANGPFLLGARTIADAFFTPVAARLRSYSVVGLSEETAAYRDTLLNDADFLQWEADSLPNSWDVHGYSVIDGMYR